MGSGIAESVARAGIQVSAYEPEQGALRRARERVEESLTRAVNRSKLDRRVAADALDRIQFTTSLPDLAEAELLIEAVVEDLEVKRTVFRELDRVTNPGVILASNTSSIPVAELASATNRPDRVLGLHFFSPVPVMELVEVVRALETSDRTVEAATAFCNRVGKVPILTKDRSGFIVNLLLVPYLVAAVRMHEEGFASREAIDDCMRLGCGHPMGPLALCDLIGLDVIYAVCNSLYEEFKRAEYAPPPLIKRMVAAGRLGRKAGRGFYEYAGKAGSAT
ncbi:MAG: 3-hydroxybutyryl-CoA dehydrogenase [Gemmatimonas sp.]|nr:3-hydroxybutyryl-CoA dehydrogenase [Gemmatimonas sp.]